MSILYDGPEFLVFSVGDLMVLEQLPKMAIIIVITIILTVSAGGRAAAYISIWACIGTQNNCRSQILFVGVGGPCCWDVFVMGKCFIKRPRTVKIM